MNLYRPKENDIRYQMKTQNYVEKKKIAGGGKYLGKHRTLFYLVLFI